MASVAPWLVIPTVGWCQGVHTIESKLLRWTGICMTVCMQNRWFEWLVIEGWPPTPWMKEVFPNFTLCFFFRAPLDILPFIDFVGWCNLLVWSSPEPSFYIERLQVWTVTAVKVTKPAMRILSQVLWWMYNYLPEVQVYVRLRDSSQFWM